MRGKAAGHRLGLILNRITPAYAGKRDRQDQQRAVRGDHPRVCGEKLYALLVAGSLMGSPPHVRGKVLILDDVPGVVGITPAYAGKRRKAS